LAAEDAANRVQLGRSPPNRLVSILAKTSWLISAAQARRANAMLMAVLTQR
jgi:hypothetical protein